MGTVGILNVGAGDTKLTFDKTNMAETIRAGQIVRDMLRRGYALLIEVDDGAGGKTHARAMDFDENTAEYIIAAGPEPIAAEPIAEEPIEADPAAEAAQPPPEEVPARRRGRPPGTKVQRVSAVTTNAIAVSRTAGG